MKLLVTSAFEQVLCFLFALSVQPTMYIYVVCKHVSVSVGNIHSTSLLAGPGDMELWQPCLYWSTGFSSF